MSTLYNQASKVPLINLVGCGGCGINLIDLFVRYEKDYNIPKIYKFDTSTANVTKDDDVNILTTDGGGSGKVRTTHAKELKTELTSFEKWINPNPEIAIIISSVSGGSGNTLLTFMLAEFAKRGVQPILFLVADTSSEIDNKNTKDALNSIMHSANVNSIYVPVSVYHNNETDRNQVDKMVIRDLTNLIHLLTVDTYEVDRMDRIHWLNASKTINVEPGVVTLKIYSEFGSDSNVSNPLEDIKDDDIYDSVLSLGVPDKTGVRMITSVGRKSRFSKEGVNISEEFPYPIIGCITPSNREIYKILDTCQSNLNEYNKYTEKHNTSKRKINIDANDPNILI